MSTRREEKDITHLLNSWSLGDEEALDQIVPALLDELERLAGAVEDNRRAPATESSELVHDAFIRLLARRGAHWPSRNHFFAYMHKTMRSLVLDRTRKQLSLKRQERPIPLRSQPEPGSTGSQDASDIPNDELTIAHSVDPVRALSLKEALKNLGVENPRRLKIVHLRLLSGFTVEETARVLALSPRTVKRELQQAKLWLLEKLSETTIGSGSPAQK